MAISTIESNETNLSATPPTDLESPPSIQHINYPSAELMLSIVQKEYDIENSRKSTLETRAGILLTLAAAILTFILSTIETALIKFPMTSSIEFLFSFIYLSVGLLTIVSIIVSLIQLVRVVFIREYKRFDTSTLNEMNAVFPLQTVAIGLIESYHEIISFNQLTNDDKTKVYRIGTYSLLVAIFGSIIFYGFGLYL